MKFSTLASIVGAMLVCGTLAACSSDSTDTDGGTSDGGTSADSATPATDAATGADTSTGTDAAPGTDASVAPTFANVYATVIQADCTSCHSAGHSTGLDMSSKDVAYTNLVGKASGAGGTSTSCTGKTRVVANDSAASLLWTKIDHTAGCGNPMPLARPKLAAAKIKLVEDWIKAGAKND